jgi:hypothetical protein
MNKLCSGEGVRITQISECPIQVTLQETLLFSVCSRDVETTPALGPG